MKFTIIIFTFCFFLIHFNNELFASSFFQNVPLKDSVLRKDSLVKTAQDSIITDTTKKNSTKGDFEQEVIATSEDSSFYDAKKNIIYLFGKARVVYGDKSVDAGYIRLNQNDKTIFAKGTIDSIGRFSGLPIFQEPAQGTLTADSVYYNFETSRGRIYSVYTEQDGGYITGGKIKKQANDEVHLKGVTYSTCNLPSPHQHFGIVITRGIATQKQIVTGPAYMVIEDVPIPLPIPFGFFPKPDKRVSGIILPQVGEDAALGFFFRDFGYYVGLNDYWDMTLKGSVYSKGSYEANIDSRYIKRYKYTGNVFFSYGSRRFGVEGTPEFNPQKDFSIRWSHSQNANAKPGTNFSASVNASTRGYFRNQPGNYDFQQITQNSLQSSISYSKTWANTPFSLSSSLSHSQDLTSGLVTLGLPNINFNMTTLNPFDSKSRAGVQKWYQRIAIGYNLRANNELSTQDSSLFTSQSLKKLRNGVEHAIPISLSSTILKYFQFSQSINYSEKWYFQTIRKSYLTRPTLTGLKDSSAIDTLQGFRRAGEYSLSGGLSTKIYGQLNFKKGKVVALRHVLTPNVGFSFRPDFGDPKYGYYDSVQIDQTGRRQPYSIFENSLFGGPGTGKSAAITFGLENNIELKVKNSATDTTTKEATRKISILQGLSINGSYNFVADSFKLSTLGFSGRTFFTEKLGISFNGQLDPYVFRKSIINGQETGRIIDRYTFQDGKLPRLTNLGFSFDYSINSTTLGKNNKSNNPPNPNNNGDLFNRINAQQSEQLQQISRNANAFVDFSIPWNLSFFYNFNYSNNGLTKAIVQTLNANGDFSLTPKWKVQYTTGYDFLNKEISLTSFSIYRDLHCWDLSVTWVPFGQYQSYSVNLRVKASILQDLKLSKRSQFVQY